MKARFSIFNVIFGILGASLVIFVLLPLASTVFSTPAPRLAQILADPQVLRSIGLTFQASALSTGIAALTGVPLAYLLARRRFWGKRLVEGIIDLPVVVPHTAAGIALLMVFGGRGLLGDPLGRLGIYFTDRLAGIVVAMLFVSLPYLVNMSREAFALIDPELEKIALVEGASPWQAFSLCLAAARLAWSAEWGADDVGTRHQRVRGSRHTGLPSQDRAGVDLRIVQRLWSLGRASGSCYADPGGAISLYLLALVIWNR